jgi:sirohydrochlorin cobaltochelatase
MIVMDRRAVILYAHGAQDARWAEPFERLLRRVREKRPETPAALAFLDYIKPDLKTSAQALATQGVTTIRIVPLFFGRGGHLREDFPKQMAAAQAALPQVKFEVVEAAGEAPEVLEALANFALSGFESD